MKRLALVLVLLVSVPAYAAESVRAEVLQPTPEPNAGQVIGAQVFGMGIATFIGGAAALGWGPDTSQNERLGWGLLGGSLVLSGIGYLVFEAAR
jgi:hypothetical protein